MSFEEQLRNVEPLLTRMEKEFHEVKELKDSKVKLPAKEFNLLCTLGELQTIMWDAMKDGDREKRDKLYEYFGGDQVARIREVVDEVQLSDMNAKDQRLKGCRKACDSMEQVLSQIGSYKLKAPAPSWARGGIAVSRVRKGVITGGGSGDPWKIRWEDAITDKPIFDWEGIEEAPTPSAPPWACGGICIVSRGRKGVITGGGSGDPWKIRWEDATTDEPDKPIFDWAGIVEEAEAAAKKRLEEEAVYPKASTASPAKHGMHPRDPAKLTPEKLSKWDAAGGTAVATRKSDGEKGISTSTDPQKAPTPPAPSWARGRSGVIFVSRVRSGVITGSGEPWKIQWEDATTDEPDEPISDWEGIVEDIEQARTENRREKSRREVEAVTLIQRIQNKAATQIQKRARGIADRKRFAKIKKQKRRAATNIQSAFRGHRLEREDRARKATKIQALFRGRLARKQVLQLKGKAMALDRLRQATENPEVTELTESIAAAEKEGCPKADIDKAKKALEKEIPKQKARDVLAEAQAAGDAKKLKDAIAQAQKSGLSKDEIAAFEDLLKGAENKDQALKAINDAMASKDIAQLKFSIQQAKDAGIDAATVGKAEQILKEEEPKAKAREVIEAALAKSPVDVKALDEAVKVAKAANLDPSEYAKCEAAVKAEAERAAALVEVKAVMEKVKDTDLTNIASIAAAKKLLSVAITTAKEKGVHEADLNEFELRRRKLHNASSAESGLSAARRRIKDLVNLRANAKKLQDVTSEEPITEPSRIRTATTESPEGLATPDEAPPPGSVVDEAWALLMSQVETGRRSALVSGLIYAGCLLIL